MKLTILTKGIESKHELAGHAQRRIGFALGRFEDRIASVTVRVVDVNGTRGGVDKRCRIHVVGDRDWSAQVEENDANAADAVDRAAERVGRAVARLLERRKESGR